MHEWHTSKGKDIISLINSFIGYEFDTDYGGRQEVKEVRILSTLFSDEDKAITFVTNKSYGSNTAYLVPYTAKKLTKAYQNAFNNFLKKYNEYIEFKRNLTIAYGRKSTKVTCPYCGSSISLKYGGRFKVCPVCGSKTIISDSNWKMLDTKRKMVEKASENLQKEATMNDVTFVCGIEWHC